MQSWDIKLDGQQYMFPPSGPGLVLGKAPKEPGDRGQVGSVVIESLHGGIGRPLPNGVLRYKEARGADCSYPRLILPAYDPVSLGTFNFTQSQYYFSNGALRGVPPTFSLGPVVDSADANVGQMFLFSKDQYVRFDPDVPGSGILISPATLDAAATGSSWYYNGTLWFGVSNNNDAMFAVTGSIIGYTPSGGAAGVIFHGASGHGITHYVRQGTGATVPELAYAFETGASLRLGNPPWKYDPLLASFDPGNPDYFEFPPTDERGIAAVDITWITVIGKMLILFTKDGRVLGADEQGILTTVGRLPGALVEETFGRRAAWWQDGLLVPSRIGLFHFSPQALTLRPISGNFLQAESEERLRGEVYAVGQYAPYGFFAVRNASASEPSARPYMLVEYGGGLQAVHDIVPAESSAGRMITDFYVTYSPREQRTLCYYVETVETAAAGVNLCELFYIPLRLPTDQSTDETHITASMEVDLYPLAGPVPSANVTKRWSQLRGRWKIGHSGNARLSFTVLIDGVAVNTTTISADGSYVVPLTTASGEESKLLGRDMTLSIAVSDPDYDTRVELPLSADFIWEPSNDEDAFTVYLWVSGEVSGRDAASWGDNPWDLTVALLAMQNTTVDFEHHHGTVWRTFIEHVELTTGDGTPEDATQQTSRVAKLSCRRVS